MTEEQPIATEHDLDIELHNDRTKHLKKGKDFMKSGTCARSRRQTHNAGLPYMGIHGRIFLVLHFHVLSDADGMCSAELRSLPWRRKRRGLQATFQHNAQRLRSDGTEHAICHAHSTSASKLTCVGGQEPCRRRRPRFLIDENRVSSLPR